MQHNRTAYPVCLEAAERGNGGAVFMSNRLLPYDTIIKAHEGDPIAIQAVLDRYAGYIRYFSKMNGYYNSDMEDYIRTKLIESLFKFRLG